MAFSMQPLSTAGSGGYLGIFYQICRDIIADVLFQAIAEFFMGGELPKSWTSTYVVPSPNVNNPSSFTEFRPNSLFNFGNKIITRLLMTDFPNTLQILF